MSKRRGNLIFPLLLVLATFALWGCGGGGGGNSSTGDSSDPPMQLAPLPSTESGAEPLVWGQGSWDQRIWQ